MANYKGLTSKEAKQRLEQYGKNELVPEKEENLFLKIIDVLKEPMFLLLLFAAAIYFVLGEPKDGAIMLIFVVFVIGIDVVQEWKTDQTLKALKNMSSPKITVVRDGEPISIDSKELVPGDLMQISEGEKIPADGLIISMNDLCVDESTLTGESHTVWKTIHDPQNPDTSLWPLDRCFAGTLVTQGSAYITVTSTGTHTEYGKIGNHIAEAPDRPTPLEKQTAKLVKYAAMFGIVLFILVGIITYFNVKDLPFWDRMVSSILAGITLAMAMIPEEFPVILTVFLSMGAWRIAKKHSLIRRLPSVETLGAVSVLCVDKTGTLTKNQMEVQDIFTFSSDQTSLVETMGLACETEAYDPMEKAMLSYCSLQASPETPVVQGQLIHEYPFTSETKRMGHIWRKDGNTILAAKGSPENMLPLCSLSKKDLEEVQHQQKAMAQKGLRVIAVARAEITDIPSDLSEVTMEFVGLVGLADPPREAVPAAIETCKKAGVRIIMITGDNGDTALSIAKQIGIDTSGGFLTGAQIDALSPEELKQRLKNTNIFARVIPEHKMKLVNTLKELGHTVAMTGDGVNDAPALKYSDIGISMGSRGTEVAREASDMILLDDNFETIVETIKDGRRIYDNIRKAVSYVLVIHIPIALTALFAPLLGIASDAIMLLPLHVVLLELIVDPTCSIVFERQPADEDIMSRPPRDIKQPLVESSMLIRSILQGLIIFIASFGTYYCSYCMHPENPEVARSLGLCVLFVSNLFLVYVNSSTRGAFQTFVLNLKDPVLWAVNGGVLLMIIVVLYTPLSSYLKLAPLSIGQILFVLALSAVAVLWYEVVKWIRRTK